MKRLLAITICLLLAPLAFADDSADKHEDTVNTTKNPITGSVTTTKKHVKKKKNGKDYAKTETTEKTKVTNDGDVKKTTETSSEEGSEHK